MADLISFREEKTPATNFSSPSRDFYGYRSQQGLFSPIATRLHTEVEESHVSSQWSPSSQTNEDDIHFLARTRLGKNHFSYGSGLIFQ